MVLHVDVVQGISNNNDYISAPGLCVIMEIPFLTQVCLGDVKAVDKILSASFHQGLNVNATDGDGRSALTIAVEDGNIGKSFFLLVY